MFVIEEVFLPMFFEETLSVHWTLVHSVNVMIRRVGGGVYRLGYLFGGVDREVYVGFRGRHCKVGAVECGGVKVGDRARG